MKRRPTTSRWVAAIGAIGIVASALIGWSLLGRDRSPLSETSSARSVQPLPAHRVFQFPASGDYAIDRGSLLAGDIGTSNRLPVEDGSGVSGGLARVAARQWVFPVASLDRDH